MNARSLVPALALLCACQAETSFQNTDDGGDDVQGKGELEWLPEALEFLDLQPAITVSQMLKLTSVGENNLVIDEVRIVNSGGGVFYMGDDDFETIELAPGTSREFAVTATMDEWVEVAEGLIRVDSNDSDYAPHLEIACAAYPAADWGADTGGAE
ncbi:MAG: hypothetical protein ABIO70_07205 [Pseudomonadota bacterium]